MAARCRTAVTTDEVQTRQRDASQFSPHQPQNHKPEEQREAELPILLGRFFCVCAARKFIDFGKILFVLFIVIILLFSGIFCVIKDVWVTHEERLKAEYK